MLWVVLSRKAIVCLPLLLVGLVGCGGGVSPQPVSGTVSIKGKGPLAKGTIRFTNREKNVSAVGVINAVGEFQLSSAAENDGALPGDYTITLAGTESGQDYDHPNDPVVKVIDAKYDSDDTTDLKLTVKSGKNAFKIELDPAK